MSGLASTKEVAMRESRLHVTFVDSAGGSLRFALARLNGPEDVETIVDDFSMGLIDPGDAKQRAEWEREQLDEDEPVANSGQEASSWEKISTWPGRLVVWMSSHSGLELCGLHALLWRLPHADIHLVDVAEVEFRDDRAPRYDERQSFAIVRDDRIVEHDLINLAKPISVVRRTSLRERWQQLQKRTLC